MITTQQIKELREETGLSIMQCKSALEEAGGDRDKAITILKKKGAEIASKKSDRTLGAGAIVSYIHAGETVGVMVELLCETDFVAKNPEFKSVAKDIAMHIAAMSPSDTAELLEQPFIKDESKPVRALIEEISAKVGEKVEIRRFTRYALGEG